MIIKFFAYLTLTSSFTGFGATWLCSGDGHSMKIDDEKKIASISGATTNEQSFNLGAIDMEVQELRTGERYVQFSVSGPSSWQQEGRDSEGFVTVSFDRSQNAYVSVVRRQDHSSGELEFLPFITMTCDVSN